MITDINIRLLVFDCDGILLESNEVKQKAFSLLGARYGENARRLLEGYHAAHPGVSRVKKFEWFSRTVLGHSGEREITERADALGKAFAELVTEGVLASPLVPGVMDVLEACHNRLPMYVCSGTPQQELETIIRNRGLEQFFTGIYGTPPDKTSLLRSILDASNIPAACTLMVGDSSTDREAAEANGTLFFARGEKSGAGRWPYGENLHALLDYLRRCGVTG